MRLRVRPPVAGLVLLLAACTTSSGSPSTPAQSAAPALRPSGVSARTVDYRCIGGRLGTITVAVPDLHRLAQVLNPINVCEYDGGLAEASLTIDCDSGSPARIHLVAVDGKLPADTSAAC